MFLIVTGREYPPTLVADVPGSCLENLVSFMYTGQLRLSADTVDLMLIVATQLEMTAVVELCQNYIDSQRTNHSLTAVKQHPKPKDSALQSCQVIGTVSASKLTVKSEQANSANSCMSASKLGLSATPPDTGRSFGQHLQLEESTKSEHVAKSPITSGHRQTVGGKSLSLCKKRKCTSETDVESSAPKQSVPLLCTSFKMEADPDWKPDARFSTHQYNTRKHSHSSVLKLLSTAGVRVQSVPQKRSFSSSDETYAVQIASKLPSSSVGNKTDTSTVVYCLPAWQISRRILLAARVLRVTQMKAPSSSNCLPCPRCKIDSFLSQSRLNAHVLSRHPQWYCCFFCSRRFASFVALLRHRADKHRYFPSFRSRNKKPRVEPRTCREVMATWHNRCGWCGLKFASRSKLLEHRQAVHRKHIKPASLSSAAVGQVTRHSWRCTEKDCGLVFKYKDSLRVHMDDQHPNVIFSCPECRFKTQIEHILKRYYCLLFIFIYLFYILFVLPSCYPAIVCNIHVCTTYTYARLCY